jgi:hypothetical protein
MTFLIGITPVWPDGRQFWRSFQSSFDASRFSGRVHSWMIGNEGLNRLFDPGIVEV